MSKKIVLSLLFFNADYSFSTEGNQKAAVLIQAPQVIVSSQSIEQENIIESKIQNDENNILFKLCTLLVDCLSSHNQTDTQEI